MEYKKYWLLASALCLGYVCPQSEGRPPYACQCLMDAKDRRNCDSASAGITAEQCTAKGCCFDATIPNVPWCFVPSGQRASLHYAKKMIELEARLDCGYQGITRKRCQRIGCCFDPKTPSGPVCFHPTVNNGLEATMEQKGVWLLSIILIIGLSTIIEAKEIIPECRCKVDPKERKNCGPPGITPEQCRENGCCFSSEVAGVPWCFGPTPQKYKQVCPSEVKVRTNCGYPGISGEDCEKRGCCFESKPPAVPWCFFHIPVPEEC